ncbi:MAG: hypothetical protein MR467_01390, partial [Bacillales bacterium]|nr:hypothetical protein [Bacillales bacterium]
AGIDVVEIHGDRLVGSLCSPIINKRNDEFGGSFENRIKFALMVVKAIKEVSGDMLIEYKLPIITRQKDGSLLGKGGLPIEEAAKLAALLEKEGVDMIHVAQANHTGNMNDTIPAMGTRDYTFMIDECKEIRKATTIPLSIVGRVLTPKAGEALLSSGVCDMIGYGRSLLADPDFDPKYSKARPIKLENASCVIKAAPMRLLLEGSFLAYLMPRMDMKLLNILVKPNIAIRLL